MRINSIEGLSRRTGLPLDVLRETHHSMSEAGSAYRRLGWRMIGEGAYAKILSKAGQPYVMKVFTSDGAYRRFLRLVQLHPSRHFPKLHSEPIRLNREYWAVLLERLEPVSSRQQYLIDTIQRYVAGTDDKIIKAQRGIYPAAELVALCRGKGKFDLFWPNFMWRGTTLVITDPIAW